MKYRRKVTKPFWSNCYLALFILYLLGKIIRTKFIRGHLLGITKHGHLVHFKSLCTHDMFRPLWFKGFVEIIKCKKV